MTIKNIKIKPEKCITLEKIKDIVESMRKPICYKKQCINENNILYKCILCKKYLSATQWGPLLETYIKKIFNFSKPDDEISGDCKSKNNKNIEIKVSLGDNKEQFNFVQIRPDHKIDYYLLLCYNVNEDEFGKIYWFLGKSKELYKLIPKYGGYAHGTIAKHGKIDDKTLFGKNLEFALRPKLKGKNKQHELWNELIKNFATTSEKIIKNFN